MIVPPWIGSLFNGNRVAVAIESPVDPSSFVVVPADVAWNNFLESQPMNTILTARRSHQLPKSPLVWGGLCQTACKLWIQLDDLGLINYLPTVPPSLCLLIKGKYYFDTYPAHDAQRLMFEEEPYTNLLRSIAACKYSPYSFAQRIIETHSHQLILADYAGRRNPLHILCSHEHHDAQHDESLVALFCKACSTAALQMDSQGLYPLHQACRSAYTWSTGIETLVSIAPHVVLVEHRGQTPFIMAAMAYAEKNETSWDSVSSVKTTKLDADVTETLFQLLRLHPDVIQNLSVGRSDVHRLHI